MLPNYIETFIYWLSAIQLSHTVRKFEHDRKCQPWWSFHQSKGKHLEGMTSLWADTNTRTGKSRLDSSCGTWTVEPYPLITTVAWLTIIWPPCDLHRHTCPQAEQMTCPTCKLQQEWDRTFGITGSPGWAWPEVVVMFTAQAMTSSQWSQPRPNIPLLSVLTERNTTVE